MNNRLNLYCKVFVDTDLDRGKLLGLVVRLTSGSVDRWTVVSDWGEIDIGKNPDFESMQRQEDPDGFLYYRFCLDIEPTHDGGEQYVNSVGLLLEGLWGANCKVVASCDFEDELPRQGGYKRAGLESSDQDGLKPTFGPAPNGAAAVRSDVVASRGNPTAATGQL